MKEKKTKERKEKSGFGQRLAFAIILTVVTLPCALLGSGMSGGGGIRMIFAFIALVLVASTVLQYVAAFAGKKHEWANVISIVIGSLWVILLGLGALAIVGGVRGRKVLKRTVTEGRAQNGTQSEVAEQSAQAEFANGCTVEEECNNEYNQKERQRIKRSDFKLELYDSNIDEKTWKAFKKTATQDELTVIAIGAKYRVAHGRILNAICAIGIILSIALFWPTGGWSLVGYPVFAFLATKSIRYEDTYSQSYRLLSKENKAFVDSYYNSNVGLKILDGIIKIAIFWITIPYQAILLLIGTFAPNFVISKNGILVSLPNGYDVGNLGAVGAYYASFSFIDEALANRGKSADGNSESSPTDEYYKKEEYTYTDEHGYEQTVYSDDKKNFYDAGGHYVGNGGDDGDFKTED